MKHNKVFCIPQSGKRKKKDESRIHRELEEYLLWGWICWIF